MTETVLFVGGIADGKRACFDNPADIIDIPVLENGGFGRERYYRMSSLPGKDSIYISESESPDNLIPLLIEGYRRKE